MCVAASFRKLHKLALYSKTSIARARIARIPDRSYTLADSMFRFFAILNSYYCCVAIFTSQNRPKCEFNSHFGQFRLAKMVPTNSSYRSLTVFRLKIDIVFLFQLYVIKHEVAKFKNRFYPLRIMLYLCSLLCKDNIQ